MGAGFWGLAWEPVGEEWEEVQEEDAPEGKRFRCQSAVREIIEGGRSSLDPPQVVPGSPGFRGLLWIPGYKAVFSGSPAVCGPKSAFPGSRFRKGVFSGSPYQKRPSLAPEFQDRTSGVGRTK